MKVPTLAWLVGVVLLVIGALCWRANQRTDEAARPPAANSKASSPAPLQPVATETKVTPGTPTVAPRGDGVRLRPLAVAKQTPRHEWTAGDGKSREVIAQIAHNDLERQRLLDENARIQRRQLVYRNDTAAAVMQRARANGESVTQLTLPGLDGQEWQVAIERADLEPSQQAGSFSGQLVGRTNSLVTLAFQFGREAFTILSPDDGLYLQGHPREPGEVIITSFDPQTYLSLPGGEPIRTTNTFSIAQ